MWPPAPSTTWLFVTMTPSDGDDEAGARAAALALVTGDRAAGADRDDRGLDLRRGCSGCPVASAIAEVLRAALLGWRTITVRRRVVVLGRDVDAAGGDDHRRARRRARRRRTASTRPGAPARCCRAAGAAGRRDRSHRAPVTGHGGGPVGSGGGGSVPTGSVAGAVAVGAVGTSTGIGRSGAPASGREAPARGPTAPMPRAWRSRRARAWRRSARAGPGRRASGRRSPRPDRRRGPGSRSPRSAWAGRSLVLHLRFGGFIGGVDRHVQRLRAHRVPARS